MDTEIIDALRAANGKVGVARVALKTSRQHIYDRMRANPEIEKALAEIRENAGKERAAHEKMVRRVLFALQNVTVDEQAADHAKAHADGNKMVRELFITAVAKASRVPESDVRSLFAQNDRVKSALSRRVSVETSPAKEPRVTVNTSLTEIQLRWCRSRPNGTVARLLAEVVKKGAWPTVSDTTDPKTQTTFSVSKTDADALHQAAMDRGETSQTILRQVIEVARRANPRGR